MEKLKGRIAVVTGANSGMGLATVRALSDAGACVIMLCRSEERGRQALEQLKDRDPILLDPEYLISCSHDTHQAITWGNEALLPKPLTVRRPGDTCPWK